MTFRNARFPTRISYGCSGGPAYRTDDITLDSGHEQRNAIWSQGRCSYDVAKACRDDSMRTELLAFFRAMKGKAYSFRFKDPTDYEVVSGEGVLSSLGSGQYQLYKRYTLPGADAGSPTASYTEDRIITLPLSVVLKQGVTTLTAGVHYTLNEKTGVLTVLSSPTPAPDSWTGEFDVPCRFDTDSIRLVKEDLEFFRSQNIPIVEVRAEEE